MSPDATITLAAETEIKSPFLPGTHIQYAWDSTSLGMFKTCPRLYWYTMVEGYTPNEDSIHLRFGQEYHKALEDYDRLRQAGEDRDESIRTIISELLIRCVGWNPSIDTKAGRYKNLDNLLSLVIDYLDKYEDDPASTYILDTGDPAVELSFRFELDWGPSAANEEEATCRAREQGNYNEVTHVGQPYILCGHLDRVVTFGDDLFVMDRKTAMNTISDYFFEQFEPNNQMTLYTLASQVILSSPVKGVIIDAAQILLEKPNFYKRGFTFRTQDQLNEWIADLKFWFDTAERYAVANHWPMNDTACGNYGGCKFRGICSKSPSVRGQFLKSGFTKLEEKDRWNPLKPR